MPGYGVVGPDEGSGLLAWSWAEERLLASRNYWVASAWPDGRPHVMPVWGVWHAGALWFSSSRRARKTRNLTADPRCAVATENAVEPVVVEGAAALVTDMEAIAAMLALVNAKYGTDIELSFYDPAVNATFRVQPRRVFALTEEDFTGSPTRWDFTVD
jgi:nitroimidazol reductase NimA-like FMN-containing flavoprotein (pyridoxamine 5'-phosphate oxidase superfamily)